ncbi:MAG: hypothetical protein ACREM8_09980, partial [Vulcanimicrobiaceae bacterium]
PGQPEREQVELLDAQDVTHSVRVYERRHVADQISGRFYLPHAAATGPNARLRVTTWDAAGMPIAGFSAPFTVGGAAAGTGGPKVAPALMLAAAGALVAVVLIGHWIWSALAGHGRPLPSAVPPPIALASPRAVASAGPSRTVATPVPWGRFATLRVLPALTFRGGCEPLGSGTFVQRIEFHNGSRSPISINYDLDPAGAHRPNYERYGVYLPPGAQIEGAADLKPGTCAAGSTFWYDAVRAQSSPQRFATDSVRADQIPHNVNFSRPHDPRLWSDWAKVIRQPRIAFSSHCDIAPGGSRISLRFRNDAEVAVSFNYGINMSKTTAPDPFEHGIVIGPRQLSYAAVFTIPGRCGDWELWTQNFDYGT